MYCVSKHVHPQEVPGNPLYTQEDIKRIEPGYFQWCPMPGPEVMGTNWNTWGFLFEHQETFFTMSKHCTNCPERLWHLHPWRYLKAIWMWSCATYCRLSRGCSNRGIGPDELQGLLKFITGIILWFLCIRSLQMAQCHGLFLLVKFHNWEQKTGGKV